MGKLSKLASALDMSKKARMQRAKEMGFDTDTSYIHESPGIEPIEEIHSEGRFGGIFSLPDDRAGYYPNTQEFLLRDEPFSDADIFATYSKNPREASDLVRRHFGSDVDVDEYINYAATFDDIPSSILDDDRYADLQKLRAGIARLGGASSVTQPDEFSNTVQLLGGPGVRSINAAFDPAKKGSPNLMAGVAGATVGAGALMQGEDAEASFLGQTAKMANKAALEIARKMKDTGATKDEIFDKTGWFQGADDAWRFEVDDSQMSVNAPQGVAGSGRLGDRVDHAELMDNYPDMRDMQATIAPQNTGRGRGSYSPGSDSISVAGDDQYIPSGVMHEAQHAIQAREGFARGGSHSEFGPAIEDGPSPYQQYRNLAGEVEARNVQGRLNMSPDERKLLPPWTTEDVPRSEQIVKFGVAPALVGGSMLFSPDQAMASANEFRQRRESKKDKWRQLRGRDRKTQATGKAAPVEHQFLADLANKFAAYNDWTESKPGLDFILPRAPTELVDKWSYGQPTTLGDDISAAVDLM